MNNTDKKMPVVEIDCMSKRNIYFMGDNDLRKEIANNLGVKSISTPARVIGLFLNRCGFKSTDHIKIYDFDYDECGQSFVLKFLVNGQEGHKLKVNKSWRRGQGYVNEFIYTDKTGNDSGYELRVLEKNNLGSNWPDVSITVKPTKVKVCKNGRFVSYDSRFQGDLRYWTTISTGTIGGNERDFPIILINYWGDDYNPLTLECDAQISVRNFSQLCDYLNGLSFPYDFIDVYKKVCALSFDVEDYSSFEIIGYRPLTTFDSCGREVTRKCYADQIKMCKGKLDMFGFDGIHIWSNGTINAYHNGDVVHDLLFTYQLNEKYDESVVPGIRLATSKLVQTFPEASFSFLGLETGLEEGLLADVWRENSLSGQHNMFNLMNDFPDVGGRFSYSGVSNIDFKNSTFIQMDFFDSDKPKQFKKSDDLK